MKEFLLLFRRDYVTREAQPSPEQMQAMMKPWQDWMGSLAAKDKLASSGNRLNSEGKVVKGKQLVTNGPYVETKEGIAGYIVIKAATLDEAAELSKGCPVLQIGGNVEVREVIRMN